jgi:hypothetical protein
MFGGLLTQTGRLGKQAGTLRTSLGRDHQPNGSTRQPYCWDPRLLVHAHRHESALLVVGAPSVMAGEWRLYWCGEAQGASSMQGRGHRRRGLAQVDCLCGAIAWEVRVRSVGLES